MDYLQKLQYHFKPEKGWINDPNGLVYFGGYYHAFYQHIPDYEVPCKQPMHWGHARTKDFLTWAELPVALVPDKDYDGNGCWSGTAIVERGPDQYAGQSRDLSLSARAEIPSSTKGRSRISGSSATDLFWRSS